MPTFLELGLQEPINKALQDLGYEKPTVIQEKAIPQIISSTDDLKAFAQTGTGKTAAFSLPIIELADENNKKRRRNRGKRQRKGIISSCKLLLNVFFQ